MWSSYDSLNSPLWFPYTQHGLLNQVIRIQSGKGALLYTDQGETLIDAISSWWANIHGHAHPTLVEALSKQAQKLPHTLLAAPIVHEPALQLAEKLINLLGSPFAHVFFSDNGSTAVEVAVKMAFAYFYHQGTPKRTILALEQSYHGDTFGAMSVSGPSPFNAPFHEFLFEVIHLPIPNEDNLDSLLNAIDHVFDTNECAGIILEPLVLGASGMLMYKPEHLNAIVKKVHTHNGIVIFDEVMTGFGRTGTLFAFNQIEEKPDILCLSKALTGGYLPLGATIVTHPIFTAFYHQDKSKMFFHGHTYTGNPMACALALASIDLLLTPDCQQRIQNIIHSHKLHKARFQSYPTITDVRQCGTILAIEINPSIPTQDIEDVHLNHIPHRYLHPSSLSLMQEALNRGVLLRPLGNVIYLMPPYVITQSQLQTCYQVIEELIQLTLTTMLN